MHDTRLATGTAGTGLQGAASLAVSKQAFATGNLDPTRFNERLIALDVRLDALRGRDQALVRELSTGIPTTPDTAARRAVADQLGQVIAAGYPDRAKALLRILIAELRVNRRNEILPTYRAGAGGGTSHWDRLTLDRMPRRRDSG